MNPPGRSVRDADINPSYPIDLIYPEFTPANSIPAPTELPIYTDPVNRLLLPPITKFSPVNVTGYINASVSA